MAALTSAAFLIVVAMTVWNIKPQTNWNSSDNAIKMNRFDDRPIDEALDFFAKSNQQYWDAQELRLQAIGRRLVAAMVAAGVEVILFVVLLGFAVNGKPL